jgi:hypothetical protein
VSLQNISIFTPEEGNVSFDVAPVFSRREETSIFPRPYKVQTKKL